MADRIDDALLDLASAVAFPPTPDLRDAVAAELGRGTGRRLAWPVGRAIALALVAILALATAAIGLGLVPGLRLTFVSSPPPAPSAVALGESLALGSPIAPERVAAQAPSALGAPDEAYELDGGRVRSLVYHATEGLPEIGASGIGLLVQAIDGALDEEQVEKLVTIGSRVTPVSVGGSSGYWISGPPHLLRYLGPDGEPHAEDSRLVGDALVWTDGGTLYRIESALGLAETVRIGETIGR
jgi:hypothetical protein